MRVPVLQSPHLARSPANRPPTEIRQRCPLIYGQGRYAIVRLPISLDRGGLSRRGSWPPPRSASSAPVVATDPRLDPWRPTRPKPSTPGATGPPHPRRREDRGRAPGSRAWATRGRTSMFRPGSPPTATASPRCPRPGRPGASDISRAGPACKRTAERVAASRSVWPPRGGPFANAAPRITSGEIALRRGPERPGSRPPGVREGFWAFRDRLSPPRGRSGPWRRGLLGLSGPRQTPERTVRPVR